MIVFADSSAVVKLYVDEQDHQLVRGLAGLVVSALARVEVPSAIWRKHRIGELTSADAAVLVAAFEADYHGRAGLPHGDGLRRHAAHGGCGRKLRPATGMIDAPGLTDMGDGCTPSGPADLGDQRSYIGADE